MNSLYVSSMPYGFTPEFRHEALQKLASGQSPDEVAQLMGVSKNVLLRWQKRVPGGLTGQPVNPDSTTRPWAYPPSFREQALGWLQQGRSVRWVADLMGVCPLTIYRWRLEASSCTQPLISGVVRSELTSDHRLSTPPQAAAQQANSMVDQRCKYDNLTKESALEKLRQGQSITQVTAQTGVNRLTLYKLRKKDQAADQHRPGLSETNRLVVRLQRQIQKLTRERDSLKQALRVVISSETD